MEKLFLSLFLFVSLATGAKVVVKGGGGGVSKLFVFGDSYADTGNNRKSASSWIEPYGITFPGKPSGRYSNGRVFTDFLASYMHIKSPIPYRWRKVVGVKTLEHGMNFAFGGTGVFDILEAGPNMTNQILFLEKLLASGVYKKRDLESSIALVSVAGNDYSAYLSRNGSTQGLPAFITSVVNQITVNLKRIHGLGARQIAVTALQPLGCLPRSTILSSFQRCNDAENTAVNFHNSLLKQAVATLNNQTKDSPFVILDLHTAFMTIINSQGGMKFENPLKACCMGVTNQYFCGNVDANGTKKYTVCANPDSTFFWDTLHPTQQGWRAVYSALQSSLHQLI